MKEHDILSKNPAGSGGIGLTSVLVNRSIGPCNCGAPTAVAKLGADATGNLGAGNGPGELDGEQTISPLHETLNTSYNNNTGKNIYDHDSGILLSLFDFGPGTDATHTLAIDNSMGWSHGFPGGALKAISPTWTAVDGPCKGLGYASPPLSPPQPKLNVFCPPYTGPVLRCQDYWNYPPDYEFPLQCTQLGKVISFSYIRNDLATLFSNTWKTDSGPLQAPLAFITGWTYGPYAIIYDNSSDGAVNLTDQLFCSYARDGGTGGRPSQLGSALACSKLSTGPDDGPKTTPANPPYCSKSMCSTSGPCIDSNMLEAYKANIQQKKKKGDFNFLHTGGDV